MFMIGERIKIHPATDLFMMGIRYATVAKIGRKYIHVKADDYLGGRTYKLIPANVLKLDE
jgi:hypothetical protein